MENGLEFGTAALMRRLRQLHEFRNIGPPLEITDEIAVHELLGKRRAAQRDGNFQEADRICEQLKALSVKIDDAERTYCFERTTSSAPYQHHTLAAFLPAALVQAAEIAEAAHGENSVADRLSSWATEITELEDLYGDDLIHEDGAADAAALTEAVRYLATEAVRHMNHTFLKQPFVAFTVLLEEGGGILPDVWLTVSFCDDYPHARELPHFGLQDAHELAPGADTLLQAAETAAREALTSGHRSAAGNYCGQYSLLATVLLHLITVHVKHTFPLFYILCFIGVWSTMLSLLRLMH